ncbi:hypothetical protein [Labrys monachus]|uniref:Uncharacterized protein n=1 Tax=Labrys monachus TaxID=217067 RepID=A0ABU0FHJ0_9HYPH|nr:hypothetical protein [Labrys monachus]MDQ0394076.1 hypothetical protein [Labrys monachus]
MRQAWLEAGRATRADADALFALQGVLAGADADFNDLFAEILTSYLLDGLEPGGGLSPEQGEWLQSMLDGGEGLVLNAAELELLVRVIERADSVPGPLATFALRQIQHAAMTGEGPAARGRIHFSRVIDAADTAMIARLLQVARGDKRRIISRPEAEILFDMAEACTGANDPAWDGLFAEAIQAHLFAANRPNRTNGLALTTPVTLAERDSAWLQRRIQHDGRVSRAERALLALVDPHQMAGSNWDTPIAQML